MKKIIIAITAFFLLLSIAPTVTHAIDSTGESELTTKYKIVFPVAELGNCTSLVACRTYCEGSANHEACVSFAQKKGFYKPRVSITPENNSIFVRAEALLGCNSFVTCKALCQLEQNKARCSQFAKTEKLEGGERKVGPGGCLTEQSCREYCTKNPDICRKYSAEHEGKITPRPTLATGESRLSITPSERRRVEEEKRRISVTPIKEIRKNEPEHTDRPSVTPVTEEHATGEDVKGASTSITFLQLLHILLTGK